MAKIHCTHHQEKGLNPSMIHFGESSLGTRQYICAVCSRVRELGVGEIVLLKAGYGFISGPRENIFFHFSNLGYDFRPILGARVSFELAFLENDRVQAIDVRPHDGPIYWRQK